MNRFIWEKYNIAIFFKFDNWFINIKLQVFFFLTIPQMQIMNITKEQNMTNPS